MRFAARFLVLGLCLSPVSSFAINDNLGCPGLDGVLGALTPAADTKSNSGNLDLKKVADKLGSAVFAETSDHALQRLAILDKSHNIMGSDGMEHAVDLRQEITLAYDQGKLKGLKTRTFEEGKSDTTILGKDIEYKWANGHCLPSRISMQDRAQLGAAHGVVFDKKLCDRLKDQKISAQTARACVETSRKALQVLGDYDHEVRKGSDDGEFLVSANPFVPGSLVPMSRVPEYSQALALMDTCSQMDQAANAKNSLNLPSSAPAQSSAAGSGNGSGSSAK